ncbi:decaprenyl-phosphate phosphoribosyltransferase [Geobacter sp. OR-1]|uniref:decaprenyl-phosphate phosphoribosyltransferase n=1 Tax=Geobacter sp. OR-1 TaxID=1266765 RepID=UPI0005443571|nr:decaprenyl-phosphate phosphoribosyltransferase [Geobacter sp. OR-1]
MQIAAFCELVRPKQWLKNLMLFFPPFLGGAIAKTNILHKGLIPFVAFCLVSSAVYVINDIHDIENDAKHPEKRNRPLPSGRVTIFNARALYLLLLASSVALSLTISIPFALFTMIYLMVSLAYTNIFRDMAVVDLLCISSLFIIRLLAGGVAFGIVVSDWLFLTVFLLAVFLSTGKRLSEKMALGESAGEHRKSLSAYPDGFLDGTMYMTGGAVLVTYTMYVIVRSSMVYTVPLCCFGLLRYIYRVKRGQEGDPTDSLLHDIPLLVISIAWAILVAWGIYGR